MIAMHIVTEPIAHRAAARDVVQAAFGADGARVVELVEVLRSSGHLRASLVAVEAGSVLGCVCLSRSWVDARERLVDVLVLSPLAVRPDRQRTGIGTALLAAAREAAVALGAPALFLEGSPTYYARHGYVPGATLGFSRPSTRIPEPAFQAMVLPAYEPWMRGALVYCDPFWTCDAVGLRDPLLARLEQPDP